ncbi:MAG: ABC transporter substrate-binding protein [Lautropia sp.]
MRPMIRFGLLGIALLTVAIQSGAQTSERPTIRLAVGSDPAFSPIYYAAQQKLFERAGLNVQLLQLTQSADAADGLIAGTNDMAGGSETTMLTRAARGDVRTIAVFGQSARFIKLVARNGIDDPKQLKKIGIVPGSASQFVAGKILAKYGMDEKAVTWVRGAPPEFPALLARGDVDGYVLWEPWPGRGMQVGGKALMNSGDVGYSYNMLVGASGRWLEQNGGAARAVVEVLRQACDEIRADPDKAAQATQTAIKLPVAQARELLKDVECVVRDFTPQDLATYGEIAEFLHGQKTTQQRVDVNRMVQTGFARAAGR